jgi:type IV secretion system protein VirB6
MAPHIIVLVLRQVPAVASALGGGVALATQGAFGAALGRLGGAAGGLRPTNLQRGYRGVQRDVQLTSRAVATPIRAAGTAYRRRFGDNVISGS